MKLNASANGKPLNLNFWDLNSHEINVTLFAVLQFSLKGLIHDVILVCYIIVSSAVFGENDLSKQRRRRRLSSVSSCKTFEIY